MDLLKVYQPSTRFSGMSGEGMALWGFTDHMHSRHLAFYKQVYPEPASNNIGMSSLEEQIAELEAELTKTPYNKSYLQAHRPDKG